ncbi:hypothetical protein GQR58_024052 [Nymphon striatum]|nr:hypothetical protein GQR58_024052 [Nymphon striatum]
MERIDGSPLVKDSEISNEFSDESQLVDGTEFVNEPKFPDESQFVDGSELFNEPKINNNTVEINNEASTSKTESTRPKRKADLAFGQKLKALQLHNGLIPFGNVNHFLNAWTLGPFLNPRPKLGDPKPSLVKAVNFVLAPPSSHFSPLTVVMPDSDVEQEIERLYSLENMGITDLLEI